MKPSEYFGALKRHDWFFGFSDDGGVYRAGKARQEGLERISKIAPIFKKMFDAWTTYVADVSKAAGSGKATPYPELIDFDIGEDTDINIDEPVKPPPEPVFREDQWIDFHPDMQDIRKRFSPAFNFNALTATDEALDEYIRSRYKDFSELSGLIANTPVGNHYIKTIYKQDFFCKDGVYSTVKEGQLITFRNPQQMACWILARFW